MKTFLNSIVTLFIFSAFVPADEKTITFKVYGNCEMCKARIEKALKKDGILQANWDVTSKMATVIYDDKMISLDQVHEAIAKAGHDTEKVKADDRVYKRLHTCCQYDRVP